MIRNSKKNELGPATRAIHEGYNPADHDGALTPPIFMTSTYAFETAEEGAEIFAGKRPGFVYGRTKNPTQFILEQRVASLENADAAVTTASGIAAITATMWTLLKSGDTVVVDHVIYGCSYAFFSRGITKFGVNVKIIDMTDLGQVRDAMTSNPQIVFFETPSNPNVRIVDIEAVSDMAHAVGALVVVDNTFSTPLIQRPLDHGADLVVHSATKFLGGHGDLLAGIVAGSQDLINRVRGEGLRVLSGATLSPHSAFLILRGLKTLSLRMRQHCQSAETIAKQLEVSSKVNSLLYPTLDSYPQRDLANRQMGDKGGAIIAVRFNGGLDAGRRFINALGLIKCAVSLGDAETLVQHPASMTHSIYTPEERARFGIDDDLIRIAVGLEDVDDLIDDVEQAVQQV